MNKDFPGDLQSACKTCVRLDALRPGDVILCAGKSVDSKAIIAATNYGSPHRVFSHAAIVLDRHIWFESNDFGIGPIMVPIVKIERHEAERWRLADISGFDRFAVFRHPHLPTNLDRIELFDLLESLTSPYAGSEYPTLSRLKDATKHLSGFPEFKRGLLAFIDWYQSEGEEVIIPGPFCSELVALIYDQLAATTKLPVSLFKQTRKPSFTSPNDLADPAISLLEPRPELVVNEDPDIADFDSPNFAQWRSGSQVVNDFNSRSAAQVEFMKSSKRLDILSDKLVHTLQKFA